MTERDSFDGAIDAPRPKRRNGCLIALFITIGLGGLGLLVVLGSLMWLGVVSPETSVYRGSQVPKKYVERLRELGALEPDEQLEFFYSDGLTSIEEGCYFVSDRKVALYQADWEEPLQALSFDQIEDAELVRDTSFLTDSQITLLLVDGESVWFPVSSEMDRDVVFHQAILDRLSP